MSSSVFIFPGQSSADSGMVVRALGVHHAAHEVRVRAQAALGSAAVARYTAADGARLESNRDIQLAVFLATQMHLAALQAEGVCGSASVGLSLGEYSHLVHIGALTFEAALRLVDARGAAYDQAPPGAMVTVLGASREEVEAVVESNQGDQVVVVSNYNAPTQHVLAGHTAAVIRAAERLEEEYGAHTIQTEARVPMHSPLLSDVAEQFGRHLVHAPWQRPAVPYRPNVTGRVEADPTPEVFIERLRTHVTDPVRWQESVEQVAAEHGEARFVEVGPGVVLHNMLGRRWLPVRRAHTDLPDGADPLGHFASVLAEIRGDT